MAPDEQPAADLAWDACYNARDVGGFPAERGGRIRRRVLSRAERNKGRVAAVIGAVAASLADGGVVVHCHGGKDRTGIVIALLLALVGVSRPTILADYARSAARLEAPNAAWLAEQAVAQGRPIIARPRWMESRPETMQGVLAYLDRAYGGVAGYLAAVGVTPAALVQVRTHLLEL